MIAEGLGLASCVLVVAGIDRGTIRRPDRIERAAAIPVLGIVSVGLVVATRWSLLVPTVGVITVGLGYLLLGFERGRRTELHMLQELPIVVEILARRVSMGATVRSALDSLTDRQRTVVGLTEVQARIASGQRVADALSDHSSLVGAALLVTEISGAASAAALERLADRLASATLDGRAAQSQAGQQVASAAVMALLPPMVSVLYGLSDPRAAQFYLQNPAGAAVVGASLLLSGAGWFWMRFITRPRLDT